MTDDEPIETKTERVRRKVLSILLDENELAVRMLEAQMQLRRPPGLSAEDVLTGQAVELRDEMLRAARAAVFYLHERINASNVIPFPAPSTPQPETH